MSYVFVALATALSYLAGWILGVPWLVPILNTLPAFPFICRALARREVGQAVSRMLVWAAAMAVAATLLSYAQPQQTGVLFIHGDVYRREMFAWIHTGAGAESDPSRFLPQHAAHAVIFCGLALASGGVLAMPMGAALMNYMGHYVGTLAATSRRPALTMALAWHPWSLVRIASFVVLGVVLAGPVLSRVGGFEFRLRDQRRWLALAATGLVVDAVMKWLLAEPWRVWLRQVAGW